MIEDLIDVKTNGTEIFRKQHPRLSEFLWNHVTPRSFGLQLLDEDSNVVDEYTIYTDLKSVTGYDSGLHDPDLTVQMKESWAEDYIKQFKNLDDSEDLILTIGKYVPQALKALIRGDIKLGKQ